MSKPTHILIVEDLASDFELAQLEIRKSVEDCVFERVETRPGFLQALETFQPDVILSDYSLPSFDGMTALKLAKAQVPLTPFIIWTGSMSEDVAVECMRAGADNYILKENLKRLGPAIVHSIDERQLLLERRQGEEELRKSKARFVTIFENSPVAIGITRQSDGKIIHINAAFVNLFGHMREDILGHTNVELDIWANPDERQEFVKQLQTKKHIRDFETTARLRSGEERNVIVSGELVEIDGEPCLMAQILDITERKLAEEALRNSEEHYRGLAENFPNGTVTIYDKDLRITFVAGLDLINSGKPKTDYIGKYFHEIAPAQTWEIAKPHLQAAFEGQVQTYETVYFGDKHYFVSVAPIHSATGSIDEILVISQDITDRMRAEKKYQDIFEHSQEGIFQSTPEGRFIKVNTAMARIYGYDSPQDMIDSITSIADQLYIKPEDRDEFTQAFQSGDHLEKFEMMNYRKDGSIIWTSTSARTLRDMDGNILYYEGFLQDITERKLAEEKLSESEARYHGIFESAQDAIFLESLEGNILDVNQRACQIYGYSREEFLTKKVSDLVPSKEHIIWFNNEFDIHGKTLETMNVRSNGERFPVEISGGTYEFNGRKLFLIVLRDITERKLAEQKIRESEERFRALIENGLDNISLLAADGTLLWENPAVNRTLGYKTDEFVNRNIFELMHPDDMGWTQKMFVAVAQEPGGQRHGTFRLKHHDGTWHWTEATATNMLNEPSVKAIVINYRDVTERKVAEIEIQQQNDDLQVINSINEAINRGKDLGEIVKFLGKELKRIFSSTGITLYMLSPDGRTLTMQQFIISPETARRIEKMIGSTIPLIQIPIQEGGFFQMVLNSQRGSITSDRDEIQKWMTEFINTPFLPSAARKVIHKLIPQIYDILNIRSTIAIPLLLNGKPIGILDASSAGLFTDDDLRRIESISRQLTAAILHQQANEQVRRSEEFLQSVQNALSASIAILNEEGVIVQVNSAWRKFGEQNGLRHPEYCIGMNYLDICDSATGANAEEAPLTAKGIREVLTGQRREFQIEYPCHSPEEKRWFTVQITKFDDGDHAWVVLAHENISTRKQAEEAVKVSSEQFRTLFEASPEGIILIDPHDTWPIIDCNETACSMNGYVRDELIGQSIDILTLLPGDSKGRMEYLESVRNAGILRYDDFHRRKDGSVFPIATSTSLITLGGQEVVLGIDRDITERKQAESAEREQRALTEALLDTAEMLNSTLDYGEVLDHILTAVGRVVPHSAACIMLVENGIAHVARARGYEERGFHTEVMEMELSITEAGNLREMSETGQPLVISETSTYPGWKILSHSKWLHSNVGAPISIHGELVGFILLDGETPGFFTPIHAERLKAFANQAALAIQNARLLKQAQEEITERKRAEAQVNELLTFNEKILDNSPVGILAYKQTGECIFANSTAATTVGTTVEALRSQNYYELASWKQSGLYDLVENAMAGNESLISDMRIVSTYGKETWLTANCVKFRSKEEDNLLLLVTDITERKRAENELRASEERFRQLAENIQEVFWMTDTVTGEEIYISPAAEKIWGHSLEDLMTNSNAFIESIYPEDLPAVQQILDIQRAGQPTSLEYRTQRPDGSLCWVWDRAFPIFDEAGKVVRLAGIAADITERKQVEDALRESENRYRGLFQNLVIGFALHKIIIDETGKPVDYIFLEINPMFEKLTGIHANDAIGRRVSEVLPGAGNERFIQIYGQVALTGEPVHLEEFSEGLNKYYEINAYSPKHGQFAVTFIDITERKRTEADAQRHLAELEALYENGLAVGRLLNPHEIGERIIDTFARYLSWHHVAIRLLQPESDTLALIAYNLPVLSDNEKTDAEQRLRSMISKVGQGLSGWVVQTGEPFRTGNVHAHSQYVDTQAGIQSGLYMPLKIGDRILGVISVESTEPDAFTSQDERLLATLASQASIAFENAHLYQAAQLEITERRRAEKELRESQERYQLLVETSPDGIGMMDLQGNILFGNHQMAQLFHYDDPAELVGTNLISLIAPESHTEVLGYLGTEMPEGVIQEGQWLARKDGTRFFGEIRSSALQNEMGKQYAIIGQVRDVTEREQARLTIHEERQRFSALFENSPVATWLEDFSKVTSWMDDLRTQGVTNLKEYLEQNPQQYRYCVSLINILDVNQAAVIMNGAHNKEELIEKVHGLMMEETPSQVMINEFELIWEGYTSFGFEMSSLKLDGSVITGIQRIYIPTNNNAPDYARVIVTNTDITDRIEFEKRLRASEVHYRELADSITDIFFELDQDLHYSHWNQASEKLTGLSAENAIGKSMGDIFGHSEEQDRIERIYRDVLKKHQPYTFETIFLVNNQHRNFEITAYPSTRGVAVVAKDVTERKLSESLMQKRFELMEYSNEHNLEDLMQKALDEISEWTRSAIGFFQFISEDQVTPSLQVWSTDTFKNFQSSQAEVMHKPADQAGVWAEAIRQRRAVIHNDYATMSGKKGLPESHSPLVRELVVPIIRNEKIMAVIGVGNKSENYSHADLEITERFADYAWDIIERKQMVMEIAEERNQLAKRVEERTSDLSRANSNLARALRVKDEFLANMSHELRTPLNAILGLSESLAEQTAGPLNEKQQRYLNTISESGHHLLALINDILDLAKIEAGQITLDINKVDVNSVSQASLRMIKQLAQKKNLNVAVEVDEKVGLMWADERRLKQMMVNLLSNAVKFTPEGGKIGMKIEGSQDDNKVMITVWDTGIGIKEIDFERLFRPFVQLDSGLARESSGTGLGLALVAQMARLHGGSVNVQSEAGKGSRFTIILPWEPALAPDAIERMKVTGKFLAVRPGQIQKTILLIEDTQEVVMMIKDYLEMAGYKVVTAQDGLDGITQAKFSHPELILMDVQMPRMDGLEATKKLRQDPEFKYTPIIALTALAMPSDRERCIAAGMDEYISKPVNLRGLVKLIQNYLSLREEKTQPK